MQERGIAISDFFGFSKNEKRAFYSELDSYIQQQREQNAVIREEYEYCNKIDEAVRQENLSKAKTYAGLQQGFYDKFLQDLMVASRYNRGLDCHSDNYLFDEESGFSLIDLTVSLKEDKEPEPMSQEIVALATRYASDILTRGSEDTAVTMQILEKVANSAKTFNLGDEQDLCLHSPNGMINVNDISSSCDDGQEQ